MLGGAFANSCFRSLPQITMVQPAEMDTGLQGNKFANVIKEAVANSDQLDVENKDPNKEDD